MDAVGVIHQVLVFKRSDAHIAHACGNRAQHVFALIQGVGEALVRVHPYGHHQFIKQHLRFAYHPQMAIGRWVEAACVHGAADAFFCHQRFSKMTEPME